MEQKSNVQVDLFCKWVAHVDWTKPLQQRKDFDVQRGSHNQNEAHG